MDRVILVDDKQRIRGTIDVLWDSEVIEILQQDPMPVVECEVQWIADYKIWRDMKLTVQGGLIWRQTASFNAWLQEYKRSYGDW